MNRVPVLMLGGFKLLTYHAIMLPLCLLLSPLCLVSSRLFSFFLRLLASDQTYVVLIVLSIELILSAVFLILLIRERTYRSIFYMEFVLLLGTCHNKVVLSNCAVIGFTYSLFEREEMYEELLVKLTSALLLVLISEFVCERFNKCPEGECPICCTALTKQSMLLQCGHSYHEECLWRWVYQRRCCPTCCQPL